MAFSVPPSKNRRLAFKLCKDAQGAMRDEYELADVKYDDRLSPPQIGGLVKFIRDKQMTVGQLLSHTGFAELSTVLCRWPRPREIASIVKLMTEKTKKEITIVRYKVSLNFTTKEQVAAFVGPLGENMNELTEQTDIMYAWVKWDKRDALGNLTEPVLLLYGRFKNGLNAATQHVNDARAPGKPVVKEFKAASSAWIEDSSKLDAHAPSYPYNLNPHAPPFRMPAAKRA